MAAALSGVLQALAAVGGVGASIGGQAAAMGRSSRSARHARDWSERMANTAFQRARTDMEAAGINPILAAGAQSSTPGPTVPEQRNVLEGAEGLEGSVGRVISSARAGGALKSQLRILKNEEERTYHDAGRAGEEWSRTSEEVKAIRERVNNMIAERSQTNAQTAKINVERRLLETEVPAAKALQELYEKYPWLRQVGAGIRELKR